MRIAFFPLAASLAALTYAPLAAAQVNSSADLDACNNIYVEANAECTVIPPRADCQANCTPITVRAACAADLRIDCSGECNAQLEASCSASCQADCAADCKVDPGEFDCQAYCQADCTGSCEAACDGDKDGARCKASCEATCSADCNTDCSVRAPSASCEASCKASCDGSCTAKANLDCQIDCQAQGFVNCETDFEGGCKLACRAEEGSLFCDGSWVDTRNALNMCIDALKQVVNVEYQGTAEGNCENGTCNFDAQGSVGCSALPGDDAANASSFMLVLATLGLCVLRRRRQ
jgi:hypothetical protein